MHADAAAADPCGEREGSVTAFLCAETCFCSHEFQGLDEPVEIFAVDSPPWICGEFWRGLLGELVAAHAVPEEGGLLLRPLRGARCQTLTWRADDQRMLQVPARGIHRESGLPAPQQVSNDIFCELRYSLPPSLLIHFEFSELREGIFRAFALPLRDGEASVRLLLVLDPAAANAALEWLPLPQPGPGPSQPEMAAAAAAALPLALSPPPGSPKEAPPPPAPSLLQLAAPMLRRHAVTQREQTADRLERFLSASAGAPPSSQWVSTVEGSVLPSEEMSAALVAATAAAAASRVAASRDADAPPGGGDADGVGGRAGSGGGGGGCSGGGGDSGSGDTSAGGGGTAGSLFPHQAVSVEWMAAIETAPVESHRVHVVPIVMGGRLFGVPYDIELPIGGVIGHPPGAGKTRILSKLIARRDGGTLVLCPPHLITHWAAELTAELSQSCGVTSEPLLRATPPHGSLGSACGTGSAGIARASGGSESGGIGGSGDSALLGHVFRCRAAAGDVEGCADVLLLGFHAVAEAVMEDVHAAGTGQQLLAVSLHGCRAYASRLVVDEAQDADEETVACMLDAIVPHVRIRWLLCGTASAHLRLLGQLLLGRRRYRAATTTDEWLARPSLPHIYCRRFLRDPHWACLPRPPMAFTDERITPSQEEALAAQMAALSGYVVDAVLMISYGARATALAVRERQQLALSTRRQSARHRRQRRAAVQAGGQVAESSTEERNGGGGRGGDDSGGGGSDGAVAADGGGHGDGDADDSSVAVAAAAAAADDAALGSSSEGSDDSSDDDALGLLGGEEPLHGAALPVCEWTAVEAQCRMRLARVDQRYAQPSSSHPPTHPHILPHSPTDNSPDMYAHIQPRGPARVHPPHISTHARTRTHAHTHTHTRAHTRVHTHTHARTHARTLAPTHTHTRTDTCTHASIARSRMHTRACTRRSSSYSCHTPASMGCAGCAGYTVASKLSPAPFGWKKVAATASCAVSPSYRPMLPSSAGHTQKRLEAAAAVVIKELMLLPHLCGMSCLRTRLRRPSGTPFCLPQGGQASLAACTASQPPPTVPKAPVPQRSALLGRRSAQHSCCWPPRRR